MAATQSERFRGFPHTAVDFYEQLALNNNRKFWNAHRDEYESAVREPMIQLTHELAPTFGEFKLFRPNRDLRFSKDKSPYKTHQGAVTEGEGGEFYYLQISAEGLFVGTGYYHLETDQLARFRAAVADDSSGADLERRVKDLPARYDIHGRALTTAPRGYPRDHPRIGLLQHKGLTVGRDFGAPQWLGTRRVVQRVVDTWTAAAGINDWLNTFVGPSTQPPDESR